MKAERGNRKLRLAMFASPFLGRITIRKAG